MRRPTADDRLVARVRAGDETAFSELFDRHAPGLLSFCRHMLGSREEAEDAVQQVFLSAHRALPASDREMHLRAWLFAIARNRCLSVLRARRDEIALDDVGPQAVSTAGLAAEVERREDLRALLGDLQRLPADQRAALVLAELGAHSHDEIAQVLDVRREKVKALVFQAREALGAARRARELPCEEIREQLATLRGSALRRGHLRRHLEACPGCRAFRDEVARQRAALAIVLPVVPTAGLKSSVLGSLLGGGAATAAASTGGAAGGSLLWAAKGTATKLLAAAAVAGTAGGGGYVAVRELHRAAAPPPAPAAVAPGHAGSAAGAGAGGGAAAVAPARAAVATRTAPATAPPPGSGAASRHRPHGAARPPAAERHARGPAAIPAHPGEGNGRGHAHSAGPPLTPVRAGRGESAPPARGPAHAVRPAAPPRAHDGGRHQVAGHRPAPLPVPATERPPAGPDRGRGRGDGGGQGQAGGRDGHGHGHGAVAAAPHAAPGVAPDAPDADAVPAASGDG